MNKIDKENLHSIFLGIKNDNDKEAYFNKLYKKYKELVYRIAFSILKNKENSEDVTQKVFIKIWNMESQKLPKNNEACWLYSITKNEAIDLIRAQKALLNVDELYYISEENEEINNIINKDYYNRIISKLNQKEQEIISLKILSDLSFKEISQILNISESTVKWRYYKAVHTLKLLLANLGMFIITFAISLKTLLHNKERSSYDINETQQEDINILDSNTTSSEQHKTENKENYIEEDTSDFIQEDITEQVIIQKDEQLINYYNIGILSISSIFLIFSIIFTIIFTIIFVKHQLKRKNKSSK